MFAVRIAEDAELRPLEPWQAAEFLAHVDKARENIEPYIPWAELLVDEESARSFLQRYANRQAEDGVRGMNRVEWRCVPSNGRSVAVAKRLGMTLEGTMRQAFPYRGEIHDVQIWAMVREEWANRPWA